MNQMVVQAQVQDQQQMTPADQQQMMQQNQQFMGQYQQVQQPQQDGQIGNQQQ